MRSRAKWTAEKYLRFGQSPVFVFGQPSLIDGGGSPWRARFTSPHRSCAVELPGAAGATGATWVARRGACNQHRNPPHACAWPVLLTGSSQAGKLQRRPSYQPRDASYFWSVRYGIDHPHHPGAGRRRRRFVHKMLVVDWFCGLVCPASVCARGLRRASISFRS